MIFKTAQTSTFIYDQEYVLSPAKFMSLSKKRLTNISQLLKRSHSSLKNSEWGWVWREPKSLSSLCYLHNERNHQGPLQWAPIRQTSWHSVKTKSRRQNSAAGLWVDQLLLGNKRQPGPWYSVIPSVSRMIGKVQWVFWGTLVETTVDQWEEQSTVTRMRRRTIRKLS